MSNQQADMRQHEQEMREAFEAWRKGCGWKDNIYWAINSEGKYIWLVTQAAWEVWQAATLAAEARIRDLEADARRYRWIRENDNAYLLAEDVIDDAITEHKENQR